MMFYDVGDRLYNAVDMKELYYLLTGMSYREITERFYSRQTYKFIYRIRKLMKELHLQNRRQLAFYAVKNNLVSLEMFKRYV